MDTHHRRLHSQKGGLKKSRLKKGSQKNSSLNLVEELLRAIADSGQSQYAIVKGSGVPQPTLCRFVSGQRGLNLESAAKICAHLGLHLAPIRR